MRVKIGNTWYDPNNVPIMIELTDKDKTNIRCMLPEATRYSAYPNGAFKTREDILAWMEGKKLLREWKDTNE